MRGRRLLVTALLVGLATTALASAGPRVQAAQGSVHLTASGDFGTTTNTTRVLDAIGASPADLHLALGDLSYGATGAEQAWCDYVTSRVGAGFAFELVAGNHESDGENGNINDFSACLPNQLPGVVGTYGRQWYVDVPATAPVARLVMISPGITFPSGTAGYAQGSPEYDWTADAIDGARQAGLPWVVVGMHHPCLSTGRYTCLAGPDITNLLLERRVDLVLSGHEHLYQRSSQLALGASCPVLTPGTYEPGCVVDTDSDLVRGAGTVFATVGTGGVPLREVDLADPEQPYFVAWSGANASPSHGSLDLVVEPDRLTARFVPATGTYVDAFTVATGEQTGPWAADSFSRDVSSGFGVADAGGAWTVTGPQGSTSVQQGAGHIALAAPGARVTAALSPPPRADTDVVVTLSSDRTPSGAVLSGWVQGRRVEGAGGYHARVRWSSNGVATIAVARSTAGGAETMLGSAPRLPGTVAPGDRLRVRVQVTGTAPTLVRAKIWRVGEVEPSTWRVSATDTTPALQTSGGLGIVAHLSSGAGNAPVTVSVDDLLDQTP